MKFKITTPSDYDHLSRFFEKQDRRLCLYSLSSIIAWSGDICETMWAIDGERLIFKNVFPGKPEKSHLVLPMGGAKAMPPSELAALSSSLELATVRFATDSYFEEFGRENVEALFSVTPQTEYEDYVYLTDDLSTLKGNRYSKKRNLVNQFKREYMNGSPRVETRRITVDDADDCLSFLRRWCEERSCDQEGDESLACEKDAIEKSLHHMDAIGMEGLLLTIDGVVHAFGIGSRLTGDMGAFHFEKALAGIKGLYQYFDRECARTLFSGYRYINKESDMDLPGLAKAKRSYHPVEFVKSYMLTPR